MKNANLALVAEFKDDAAAGAPATPTEATVPTENSATDDASLPRTVDWAALAISWSVRLVSLAIGLMLWQLACVYQFDYIINFQNVPAPLTVAAAFYKHLHETKFYIHVGVSMERIIISFALATVSGIVIGVVMGRSKIARDVIAPYIEILRPIPAVAWIPLAILMWPTEESSIIFITFLGALFPIVLNTVHGVEQTPDVLVRAARVAGRLTTVNLLARRNAGGTALDRHRTRRRHGRVLVFIARRRDHLRPVRHRLFHLERLFPHQLPRHRCGHAGHRRLGHTLHLGGPQAH